MPHALARRRVAIAGASGFVGRALAARLASRFDALGIARRIPRQRSSCEEFRTAAHLDLREAECAPEGTDVAVYLVHGMLPSARLTQEGFADFDRSCADNFARAARKNGGVGC